MVTLSEGPIISSAHGVEKYKKMAHTLQENVPVCPVDVALWGALCV